MDVQIPQHEVYVSYLSWNDLRITARFVTDYYPESEQPRYALCVEAFDVIDAPSAARVLEDFKSSGDPVYVGVENNALYVQGPLGNCIEIRGTLSISNDALNVDELSKELTRAYDAYLSTDESLARSLSRIKKARDLLQEQVRRVEVKAANKAMGSTAATLYSQQLTFMRRILKTLERGD